MLNLKQTSLCLIALLLFSINCLGQKVTVTTTVTTRVKEMGAAHADYSRDENKTMASVYIPGVYEKQGISYDLVALFYTEGRRIIKPDAVCLHFNSPNLDSALDGEKRVSLRIKIDNEKWVDLGKVMVFGGRSYSCGPVAKVDFRTFTRIINSKKVEVNLGGIKFYLRPADLQALRDLAKLIEG